MARLAEKPEIKTSSLAIGKRFKRYGPESEKATSKADVREDETLKGLICSWEKFVKGYPLYMGYLRALRMIAPIDYSSEDVTRFSMALAEYQDEEEFSVAAGEFLSALINRGKDDNFLITIEHLASTIRGLGRFNIKNLTILGDADRVGQEMSKGSIIIDGNAGDSVGAMMSGGRIVVNGNARFNAGGGLINVELLMPPPNPYFASQIMKGYPGLGMSGGILIIKGDAGKEVGRYLSGGEIHIEGDYWGISDEITGGRIYHKGKLIVDK
jgi:hypothetical protein